MSSWIGPAFPASRGPVLSNKSGSYEAARVRDEPVILELGVDRGASTTVFLQACAEKNGQLVSVDIRDCSEVSQDDRWRFVRSDSTDVATILSEAPVLRDGIDVLYIDSLHDWRHVEEEPYGWVPYLKQGSVIFDDVDSSSARKGQRSDSFTLERQYGQIHRFVEAFFLSNLDSTLSTSRTDRPGWLSCASSVHGLEPTSGGLVEDGATLGSRRSQARDRPGRKAAKGQDPWSGQSRELRRDTS